MIKVINKHIESINKHESHLVGVLLSRNWDGDHPEVVPLAVGAVGAELLLAKGQNPVIAPLWGGDLHHREAHLLGPGGHHSSHGLVGWFLEGGPQVLGEGVAVLQNKQFKIIICFHFMWYYDSVEFLISLQSKGVLRGLNLGGWMLWRQATKHKAQETVGKHKLEWTSFLKAAKTLWHPLRRML